ncbi:MAG: Crp/Fnr family transcriptional regulator [Terriglobia bacterium]|nr:Crp/Fnr family transcriptional regulator [Terriglobia bacterium]
MSLSPLRFCADTIVRRSPAFHNLPPHALAELDAISVPVEYPGGAILMRQGDRPDCIRVVCHGRVKIYTSSQEGKSLLLKIASEGEVLGLVPAIRGIPYEMTAEASGPCVVDEIQNKDFLTFLFRHKTVCWQALQMVAAENHELLVNARRVALSDSVAGNLAKLLLDWETTIQRTTGSKQFKMLLTHQEIAEMVGTSRETVTRTLLHFRQNRWIRIEGVSMEILQREKMENISI